MFNSRMKVAVMGALAMLGRNVTNQHDTTALAPRNLQERLAVQKALSEVTSGKGKCKRQMKPTNAAALKRAAKTRNNIRKRKGK